MFLTIHSSPPSRRVPGTDRRGGLPHPTSPSTAERACHRVLSTRSVEAGGPRTLATAAVPTDSEGGWTMAGADGGSPPRGRRPPRFCRTAGGTAERQGGGPASWNDHRRVHCGRPVDEGLVH